LAFASMSPREVCKAFSNGLGRPVRYKRGPIMINVPTPTGYREHLAALEYTLGEYAQEVFPVEEAANGLTWMQEVETPRREVEIDFEQVNC
jgi:hypothetical protein